MERVGGIFFDLFPQAADVYGEGVVVYEVSAFVPELVENPAAGENLAGVSGQKA